ncbi:uracil-DNA glycosylase [Paenibacillus sp. FSL H8-0548]|nr:uracil-DNA glycosylase [Paenibacillus sp. FSL H8-0548]
MTENKRIDCTKCKYYYITWDSRSPKGCKAFGFKSSTMPSMTVLASSGKPCLHFDSKIKTQA